jgi:hypothetical protein
MVSAVKMVAKQSSTGVAPNWDVHPCKCGITPIYGYRNGNNDDQLVDSCRKSSLCLFTSQIPRWFQILIGSRHLVSGSRKCKVAFGITALTHPVSIIIQCPDIIMDYELCLHIWLDIHSSVC